MSILKQILTLLANFSSEALSKVMEISGAEERWPLSLDEERALVSACQAGDNDAFDRLVRQYQDHVFGLAWKMLHNTDDAEDIAQEVFVACYRKIGSFRGDARLGTWLYRVTVNRVKNRWKYLARRKTNQHVSLDEPLSEDNMRTLDPPDPTPGAAREAEGRQAVEMLHKAMDALSPEFREVMVLRFMENLSYEEISTVLGASLGTVKSRINRGRALLREKMEEVLP